MNNSSANDPVKRAVLSQRERDYPAKPAIRPVAAQRGTESEEDGIWGCLFSVPDGFEQMRGAA